LSLFLGCGDDCFEGCRVLFGEHGHDLAIDDDVGLVYGTHELAVADSFWANSSVDFELPQSAHVALHATAVAVCALASLENGNLGEFQFALAPPHVALCLGHDVLAALEVHFTAFDSWHIGEKITGLLVARELLDRLGELLTLGNVSALHAGDLACVASVEVGLSGLALQHLAVLCDFETLG